MPETPHPPAERGATRQASAAESSLVAGYVGLTEVGRGGFGIVYRATQTEFDRLVALKVLTGSFDDAGRARFERECRAMGSLSDHPNIVTVYAAGMTIDDRPYLAMEFLPGGSLAERLAGEPLSWQDAAAIGIKIAGALQRAHDIGVLHRDVKPDNILLSGYGEPKLGDFGIARLHGGYETQSGVVTATFAHAAPELLEGGAPSPTSDVYALASTVYELIAGKPPFAREADDTMQRVIARIITEPVPDLRPRVPDGVWKALQPALDKDPDERTPTAAAFGNGLRDALRDEGITPADMVAIPPREMIGQVPEASARADAPRRRALIAGIVALVLLVAAGLGIALASGGPDTGSTTPTTRAGQAPAMPKTLPGYQKDGRPTTVTQRVFSERPNFLDSFAWTMNGCNDARWTTVWRALTPTDRVKGGATSEHGSTTLTANDVKGTTGRSGLIVYDACAEPVFFFGGSSVGDTLVDVAATTQHWAPKP